MRADLHLVLLACAASFTVTFPVSNAQAQDEIYVYGHIRRYENRASIPNARVLLFPSEGTTDTILANDTGYYECHLDYLYWTLVFESPGLISKTVVIDGLDVPEQEREGGHGMNVDMTLFAPMPGRDFSFLEEPIGVARYSPVDSSLVWDPVVTDSMRALVQREMQDTIAPRSMEHATEEQDARRTGTGNALKYALLFLLCTAVITGALLFLTRDRSR